MQVRVQYRIRFHHRVEGGKVMWEGSIRTDCKDCNACEESPPCSRCGENGDPTELECWFCGKPYPKHPCHDKVV
jgi:hypothetical protein